MRWLRIWGTKIPVETLKILHNNGKLCFDEDRFRGPCVVIHATCSHGKEHRFDIDVEGAILKDDEGKRFFKMERARYLLEGIPPSLRDFHREHYAEIMKAELDSVLGEHLNSS